MTRVSQQTFERKCRRGDWECEYEPTRGGYAQVRSTATNRRFTVQVETR